MTIYQTEVETHNGHIKTLNINSDSLIDLSEILNKWENNNNNIGGHND